MTLTQLKLKSNTRFMKNFFLSIKNSKKILIFISILHLLGLPVLSTISVMSGMDDYMMETSAIAFALISIFCLGAAVLCGIFIALTNFSYLHKKSQVDMIYSLPIKRRTKFLSDYFSGLAVYLIPYVAACIIADMIFLVGIICIPNMLEGKGAFPIILQGEFAGLLMMAMLYTLTVLVTCCCGTLFESIMNIFMINALIPGAIAVIAAMFFANLYGVPIFETSVPVLGYTSPIGGVIYLFYMLENEEIFYSDDIACLSAAGYGKWVAFFLFFTAAYFLLSMFLYKKRKAEDVSKPYVYRLFYYILITVIMMAISLIARYEPSAIFAVILFSLIVYMIFEIVTNRGFKKIYLSFIRYIGTMVGILILCVAATATHGFGVEGKTYSPGLVKSVWVSYSGVDDFTDENNIYYGYYDPFDNGNTIEYKDKEIIKRITEIQKQTISEFRSGKYLDYYYSGIGGSYFHELGYSYYDEDDDINDLDLCNYPMYDMTFKFKLKTGGTTTRNYQLSFEQVKRLLLLDSTEQMADYHADKLIEIMNVYNSEYGRQRRQVTGYRIDYSYMKDVIEGMTQINISRDEAYEFAERYKQDYMEASEEEFLTSKPVCYISAQIPIRECFERTIEFISKHGGFKDSSYKPYCMGKLYKPNGYRSWNRNDITASFGYVTPLNGYAHKLDREQTAQLLKYARTNYFEESDCYVMEAYNNYYVIPSEYSDKAEKIYQLSGFVRQNHIFSDMIENMKEMNNVGNYCDLYLNGDYTFYNELSEIFEIRFAKEDIDGAEFSDYKKQALHKYELLEAFFGYRSAEDYMNAMDEESVVYNDSEVKKDFEEYSELFPWAMGLFEYLVDFDDLSS